MFGQSVSVTVEVELNLCKMFDQSVSVTVEVPNTQFCYKL